MADKPRIKIRTLDWLLGASLLAIAAGAGVVMGGKVWGVLSVGVGMVSFITLMAWKLYKIKE